MCTRVAAQKLQTWVGLTLSKGNQCAGIIFLQKLINQIGVENPVGSEKRLSNFSDKFVNLEDWFPFWEVKITCKVSYNICIINQV